MKEFFKGSCVALITPFKDGGVDKESLVKLLEYQLENKTDAILVLGTTGEPPTMSQEEKELVIKTAREVIGNKAKLIVGTGANSTASAIANSLKAKELGADALLVVTPYYNKCTQKGIVAHYKAIAEASNMPIIAYNVPGRTGVNISVETAVALSEIEQIVGLKEASGNINQIVALCKALKGKMAVYSGDDSLNYTCMTLGASGAISVTANILPKETKEILDLCVSGDYMTALAKHEALLDVNKNLFIEVNPIPVKYASKLLGLTNGEVRLPLTELEDKNKEILEKTLRDFNVKF